MVLTKTEICLTSVEGAAVAADAGADRVEVCTALELGGLTPSMALIEGVRQVFAGEVVVLIRPRPGDFVYSNAELQLMAAEIRHVIGAGVDGVAVGALTREGVVDVAAMELLMNAASGAPVTFHRAIDSVAEIAAELPVLRSLGVSRLLTSGGAPVASSGLDCIRRLVQDSEEGPAIVAASGIRSENVRELIQSTGVREVHFSASMQVASPSVQLNGPVLTDDEYRSSELGYTKTDPEEVHAIMKVLRA